MDQQEFVWEYSEAGDLEVRVPVDVIMLPAQTATFKGVTVALPITLMVGIAGVGMVDLMTEVHRLPLYSRHGPCILRSLYGINRFGGWTAYPWNDLLHSLSVYTLVHQRGGNDHEQLAALCHDLAEGCGLNDLMSPVKRLLPAYSALEKVVERQLEKTHRFNISAYSMWKTADHDMFVAEAFAAQGLVRGTLDPLALATHETIRDQYITSDFITQAYAFRCVLMALHHNIGQAG